MMPDEALRVTRWMPCLSITTVILGSIFALYLLQKPSSSFVPSYLLSFAVMWLTNLVSMVLNAIYWSVRRGPKWLSVTLLIQAGMCLATFVVSLFGDYFFG